MLLIALSLCGADPPVTGPAIDSTTQAKVCGHGTSATLAPVRRALAFDLDGTLLGPDERVSTRNLAAVQRAHAAGFAVILATARWFRLAAEAAHQLHQSGVDVPGPAVACSGAQVRRLGNGVDLMDVRLPVEFARAVASVCDDRRCIAWAALDEQVAVKMDAAPGIDLPPGLVATAALSDALAVAPRMLLIQGTDACAVIEAELAPLWSDRVRFVESFSSSRKRILTLTAQGADKGRALRVACIDLGIDPLDVIAFGDAENDIEMFRVAGGSVAMGQASDRVKAEATSVSAPGSEDGVAQAIERLLDTGSL